MVFAGLTFLVFVFPLVTLVHQVLPKKYRNLFLISASLFFYAWGDISYIPLLLLISAVNYYIGKKIKENKRAKAYLVLGIVLDMGILAYYKYFAFFAEQFFHMEYSIRLPLGISFFTFQTVSYIIDVYRRDIEAETSLPDYLTYILMFPQLIAGPIVRYSDIALELKERTLDKSRMEQGMMQFAAGLAAKVLIANNFAIVFEQANAYTSSFASLVTMLSIGMQYYFDFAGYSLMAIGMGNMLGFRFPVNFDLPYSAYSATTFWRRWHITLGTWFREYVYIPLGGNRVSKLRQVFNIMLVWALTGFWHGASWNFLVWGLYFGLIMIFEKFVLHKYLKEGRVLSHLYGLFVIFLGWYFVGYQDLGMAIQKIIVLFSFQTAASDWYVLQFSTVPILLSIILCIPRVIHFLEHAAEHTLARTAMTLTLILLSIASLVSSGYNPFLYFRF